jgi:hypothetical protein
MGIYDQLSELDKPTSPPTSIEQEKEEVADKPNTLAVKSPATKKKDNKLKTIHQEKEKNINDNTTSNITILQFDEVDIEQLREVTNKVQTYRLTERDIEWIKDVAYRLNKEVKRGKVSQSDILRLAITLFKNLLAVNKTELLQVLERMK